MTLRRRPMLAKDVPRCAEAIASEPAARRRYGKATKDLPAALSGLLEYEAKTAVVFEEVADSRATLCAIGISVFVQDEFLEELKKRPFWFAAELTRRLARGSSPLLSERQLREANTRGGMNSLVWEGFVCPAFERNSDLYRRIANTFIEEHRGFLWKEILCHQLDSAERLIWSMQAGALWWDAVAGRYTSQLQKEPGEILKTPHVFGMTRESEASRPGSWIGSLFEYQPPRCGFSQSEQRLLICALDGGTDQELSERLGLALDTVKKTWRLIYDRVAAQSPELIPANWELENGNAERGRAKKQHLLNYLRQHPEELRPHSRKLLQQSARAGLRSLSWPSDIGRGDERDVRECVDIDSSVSTTALRKANTSKMCRKVRRKR